jgi:hypothetical protein
MTIDSKAKFNENRNGNEREAGTEFRRNIICGNRSTIKANFNSFEEEGQR